MSSLLRASGLTLRTPIRTVTPPPPSGPTQPVGMVTTHLVPNQSNVYNLGSR